MSSTALPRSRPSSRPLTTAIGRRFSRCSSAWPFARVMVAISDTGTGVPLDVRISVPGSLAGSNRTASGRRTRTGIVRSGSRSSVATAPSQLPAIWVDTCSTVRP